MRVEGIQLFQFQYGEGDKIAMKLFVQVGANKVDILLADSATEFFIHLDGLTQFGSMFDGVLKDVVDFQLHQIGKGFLLVIQGQFAVNFTGGNRQQHAQ